MKERVTKLVKSAIAGADDNLYRAKAAFNGFDDSQLDKKYGQSDQTRRGILEGYQNTHDELTECLKWVESRQS